MVWNPFSSKTNEEPAGKAPTRADRERCWERRDLYFDCLDRAGVLVPGKEGEQCRTEREGFEANCVKSWIDHFKRRRVADQQQKERQLLMQQGATK